MPQQELLELAKALVELARRGGLAVTPADTELLQTSSAQGRTNIDGGLREIPTDPSSLHVTFTIRSDVLQNAQCDRLARLMERAYIGFFDAATDGLALTAVGRIIEWYDTDLRSNYPEANHAFLRFATTYWTYKILLRTLELESKDYLAYQAGRRLDDLWAHLFFPYDGPRLVDPERRAADQRRFLQRFAPRLDVEQFMKGNPIIIRDRKRWRKR